MHREVLVLVITITTMNICTMEDSSIMLMRTIYTMYKGERAGGDSRPAPRTAWMETSFLRALTLSATWYTWAREGMASSAAGAGR